MPINIDDLAEFSERVPLGTYVIRLASGKGKMSKNGFPMVETQFEVKEGPFSGSTIYKTFLLTYFPGKDGKKAFSPGLTEIKSFAAAAGNPFPKGTIFPAVEGKSGEVLSEADLNKAYKLIAKHLGRVDLIGDVLEDVRKDKLTGEKVVSEYPKLVIRGLAEKKEEAESDELEDDFV